MNFLVALQANEQYHQEFKPPPEGSMTGVGRQEQVVPVQDMSHDQDQIQQRSFFCFCYRDNIAFNWEKNIFNNNLKFLICYWWLSEQINMMLGLNCFVIACRIT